jgi:hypothetical protein
MKLGSNLIYRMKLSNIVKNIQLNHFFFNKNPETVTDNKLQLIPNPHYFSSISIFKYHILLLKI